MNSGAYVIIFVGGHADNTKTLEVPEIRDQVLAEKMKVYYADHKSGSTYVWRDDKPIGYRDQFVHVADPNFDPSKIRRRGLKGRDWKDYTVIGNKELELISKSVKWIKKQNKQMTRTNIGLVAMQLSGNGKIYDTNKCVNLLNYFMEKRFIKVTLND